MEQGISQTGRPAATLRAPLSGLVVPLDRVPDPVFAQRLVGDGIAIDPLGTTLHAPCDGTVVQLHPSAHAVTVRSAEGVEVLLHIGIDTVGLRGRGFTARVVAGQAVRAGQPLIDFDADRVAESARSLLTQVVVTSGGGLRALAAGRVQQGEPLLAVSPGEPAPAEAVEEGGDWHESEPVALSLAAGLHARPAAVLASVARQFQSRVYLRCGEQRASARSVVGLLRLELGLGARIVVGARGPDAPLALAALVEAIGGLEEPEEESAAPAPAVPLAAGDARALVGVPAAPGLAAGRVVVVRTVEPSLDEAAAGVRDGAGPPGGAGPEVERRALARALAEAQRELVALAARLEREGSGGARAAIFAAHGELLEDPELQARTHGLIASGQSAARAWRSAYGALVEQLAHLKNPLLAQRAADLRDVGQRVLRLLLGSASAAPELPADAIAVAEHLAPSVLVAMDRSRLRALCTVADGPTSHVAILARAFGIPAVAGIDTRALGLVDGTPAIVDGDRGLLRIEPTEQELAEVRVQQAARAQERSRVLAEAHAPAVTRDGHRIHVVANLGGADEAGGAVAQGAEGVGLLRTEFLFLDRDTAPDEEEQLAVYREIGRALGPERRLVLRTLDIGGDKSAPYLPVPPEANPFLGERGIRLALANLDLLRTQLRAAVRAAADTPLAVLFPMIGFVEELRQAVAVLREEEARLGAPRTPVGIMVEVPSAALLADRLGAEVDFFSIGTNDLTQYALAIDRGHPTLSGLADALHPGVLRLMAMTVSAARAHGKWVGVCGALASDPVAVPLLVGMGITELSASVPAVAAVKAAVRRCEWSQCAKLAERALAADTAAQVREMCMVQG